MYAAACNIAFYIGLHIALQATLEVTFTTHQPSSYPGISPRGLKPMPVSGAVHTALLLLSCRHHLTRFKPHAGLDVKAAHEVGGTQVPAAGALKFGQ